MRPFTILKAENILIYFQTRYKTNSRMLRRANKGSAIVEGAVAMCMVLSSSVAATLLIMNSGCLIFYKTKLTHVNYMAAAYAAAHDGDSALEQETTDFTKNAMTQMNLTPNNLKVTVKPIKLEENSAVQVTIANDFNIPGVSAGANPAKINLVDTEVASH